MKEEVRKEKIRKFQNLTSNFEGNDEAEKIIDSAHNNADETTGEIFINYNDASDEWLNIFEYSLYELAEGELLTEIENIIL